MDKYLILHGYNGSNEGHWQHFLYNDLKNLNKKVYFPQFPNNSHPNLEKWINYLNKFKNKIDENTTIIAHSMGVILWLHYISRYNNIKAKKIILVAPPSNEFLLSNENTISFSNFNLNGNLLKKISKDNLLIASTNDEYCTETAKEVFVKPLEINYIELPPKAGHINIKSGYGKWNDILNITLK